MKAFMRTGFILAGLAGSLSFTTALAQSTAVKGPIGEITVTAQRREEALQDVPIAVSALDTKQLANLQINESTDLQRVVPSLHMFNNITSPTNLSLSLRGGLQQDASLVVAESPVGIYVDDVYVGRLNGNNSTLSDIERVEVLRGPQGTLYGRNTGYGAIKFISRTPGEDTWLDATAGYGTDSQFLMKGSVGGSLSDAWSGSFAGQWKEKDGQYINVFDGSEIGEEENLSVRGKLRYRGLDKFDAILSVAYSDSDNDSLQLVNGVTPDVPGDAQFTTDDLVYPNGEWAVNYSRGQLDPPPLRDYPQSSTEQSIVGLTLSYEISDTMTVKSITGYVGTDDYFHTDFSGDMANPAQGFATVGSSDVNSDQYTEELQLLGTALGERLDYILGAFYLHEDATQEFGWNVPNFPDLAAFGGSLSESLIDTTIDSYAAFAQADYGITDRLKVTAGLRWTKDNKDMDFTFCSPPALCPPADVVEPTFIPLSNDSDEWTPKVGIDYSIGPAGPADSMLLYAQAARGFKGGGFSAIAIFSPAPVGTYDPETNWTYEGGMKADWLDNRLRTNLAYFFSDIQDIQQNATDTSSGQLEFPVENSGDAEIQGLEFEITAVPIDGLNVYLNGALMDGEYKNLNPTSAAAAAEVLYGVKPGTPQTPDYTVGIGFDYTFPIPGDFGGDISFGFDYYRIDDYIVAATNDFNNSGWDNWNGFIAMDVSNNWQLKLTGKNLSDDFIVVSGSRGLGGFIALPPREVMLSVAYRYGD